MESALAAFIAWLAQFRRFWSKRIDALERHLDRLKRSSSSNGDHKPER
jgi:hypothetical protein